jgi:hypothetical protein
MELLDRLNRVESKLKETLDEDEFSQFLEGYLMNRTRGKPLFEDDSSIAEAAAEYLLKE